MLNYDNHICRAKCKDTGEWVYGYYVKHNTVMTCFASDDPRPKHYIVNDGTSCDWGFEPPLQVTEVDPETVCRFIGKVDKYGNKIFENDLLLVSMPIALDIDKYEYRTMLFKCVPDKWNTGFICLNKVADPYKWHNAEDYSEECAELVEVVGNVYDNSDYACPVCGLPWNSKNDTKDKKPCMTCGEFI